MKAIILAAGLAKRMRPLTLTTHKTLLEIGGKPVIQWIVDALLENCVTDIVIVTGYQADNVKSHLDRVYPSLTINYIHNERYHDTNSIYSLALAFEGTIIDSDVILIECDLVFEPSILKRLIESRHPNVALADRYRAGISSPMVRVVDGIITELVTLNQQCHDSSFNDNLYLINIYRFSKEFCNGSFKKLLTHYATTIDDDEYYELVIGIIVYLQHETMHAEVLNGEQWTEVDDPNDLSNARFQFDAPRRREILAQSSGGYWNYDFLDFSFARNMRFPTATVLAELRSSLPDLVQNCGSARSILDRKLAHCLLCSPEHLTALNGASEAFPWLRSHFSGKRPLIPAPTCGEYNHLFPHARSYADDVGPDREEIAALAREHDLVLFVNPNTPTGSVLPTDWIYRLAADQPAKMVVVDETFIDFSGQPSLLPLLDAEPLPNVILLKSLGAALGVPGLRLGFVYTHHYEFLNYVRKMVPVRNLNSIAEHLLEIILKHRLEIQASFEQTMRDRDQLASALKAIPAVKEVHPSGGNFLLVSLRCHRSNSGALVDTILQNHKIHIEDVSDRFSGSDTHLRPAVRLPEENARLAACLDRAFSDMRVRCTDGAERFPY